MAKFQVYAEIEMEIEALNEKRARSKAETICEKRVVGQSFGRTYNDRGEVTGYTVTNVQYLNRCADCGEESARTGHIGCSNPQDHSDAGIDDPMETER